jgi:copper transport protein
MRRAVLLPALVLLFALTPVPAGAHAAFVSSQPEPGERLASVPGVVVLTFTEPLNVRLSRAVVTDPSGTRFEGTATGEREIRVTLTTNAPGVYEVDWTTVSSVDGHTLRGTFRFGVGVSPGVGAEGSTSVSPQRSDLLVAVARAVEYAALLLALGMLLLRRLARWEPALSWVRPRLGVALRIAFLAGLAVVLGEALIAAPSLSVGALVSYLTTGLPGVARLSRLFFEAMAISSLLLGGPLVAPIVGSVAALAAAGHAAAVSPAWLGISVDTLHLLAAGLWAGGILALATLRPPGGWRAGEARTLLDRFTPVALVSFLLTVGFGILRGVQELAELGDLVTSSYGQVLTVKVAAVLAMVPLSLLAWRRRTRVRAEAGIAVFVVGAAALLAAYPLPPARVGEAEAARAPSAAVSLPRQGDLTLADNAGEVLVGLTLRPGEPGLNDVLVYLLPLEGPEAAGRVRARLVVDGRAVPLESCGSTCRRTEAEIQGGERVEVVVAGEAGGTAPFDIPDLPVPGGARILQEAQDRIHELQTYRLDETLSSGRAEVESEYAFQAPDRMRAEVDAGSMTVWVAGTRYLRETSGSDWQVEEGGPILPVPSFIWDFFRPFVAPRILGTEAVDGADTRIVAFFGGGREVPVWFRLWIDGEGLVRRAEMRAQGHFMDHRYFAFDEPFTIQPPVTEEAP